MLWLRNKKYLFIFIQTSLLSLLPVLCAEEIPTQSVFSLWPSSVARVKEVGTTTWGCAGLKGTSLHTPVLVIHAWSVSHSTPQATWGGPQDPAPSCLYACFILNVENLGRVVHCWGLLSRCWFCPAMEALCLPLPWFVHYPNTVTGTGIWPC